MNGLGRQFMQWRNNGGAPLTAAEANAIGRLLSVGSVGSAFFVYGAIDGTKQEKDRTFGGYWAPGQKRGSNDVPFGAIRIGDTVIPHLFTHNPFTESAQMGATMMRVALSKLSKKDTQNEGLLAGVLAAVFGLAKQAPIANEGEAIADLANPKKQGDVLAEAVKGLVPQGLQNIAEDTDRNAKGDVIKREDKGLANKLKTAIPIARETVPVKQELRK
jgi:hypothetical protein